jgi:hypothetical protein
VQTNYKERAQSVPLNRQIAESIKTLGFGAPVLVDETLTLIGGYGRLKAAEGLKRHRSSLASKSSSSTPSAKK